ncbi:hypothetical protein D3C76_1265610 [compost metagenome]
MLEVVAQAAHQRVLGHVVADLGQDFLQVRVVLWDAVAQNVHKGLERPAFLRLDRSSFIVERAPVGELFHVFKKDQSRTGLVCPANDHPCQATNLAVAGLSALGLTVVTAVGRCPQDADRLTFGSQDGVDLENIGNIVLGLLVVGAVHSQGDWVVVYRHIRFAVRLGDAAAGAAAAGEEINNQLLFEGQGEGGHTGHVVVLACRRRPRRGGVIVE